MKRVKVNQEIEHGGLRMVNIQAFFDSLLANWVNRILDAEPNVHGWVQLPRLFLKPFDIDGLDVRYKFDDSVNFPRVESLPSYYKRMIKSFNKALVTDEFEFIGNMWNQPLWGNKYITAHVAGKKNVLFVRNWIRSGIRKVSDVIFMNGILDENHINQKLVYKQNMYAEIMTMKDALRPYQQHLIQIQHREINIRVYTQNLHHDANELAINYIEKYCENEQDLHVLAFTKKIKLEKEIKLKEFNFKLLHGILPCNRNLEKWKLKSNDQCDVCSLPQTIEHLLYDCTYVKPLWKLIEKYLGVNIGYKQILGLDNLFKEDAIVTIICFLIYKEWLVLSLENKKRNRHISMSYYKGELVLRTEIYKLCKCINEDHIDRLNGIMLQM